MRRVQSIATLLLMLVTLGLGGTALAASEHGGESASSSNGDEHAGDEAHSEEHSGDEHAGDEADSGDQSGDEHAGDEADSGDHSGDEHAGDEAN